MAYLKIHCDYCGNTWEVYKRDMNNKKARQCPHCLSQIEGEVWKKQIVPALCEVDDANRELFKIHSGMHKNLFTFDIIANHLFDEMK